MIQTVCPDVFALPFTFSLGANGDLTMEAVLQMPDQQARASVMDDVRAVVANLEKLVAVMGSQFHHTLESHNRIEMTVNNNTAKAEASRERIFEELTVLDRRMAKMEAAHEVTATQSLANAAALKELSERTVGAWMRKNIAVVSSSIIVLSMIIAVVRWFVLHYVH